MTDQHDNLQALRTQGSTGYAGLEVFDRPEGVESCTFKTDEFTSLCPITGQPDYYIVTINYRPNSSCIESKSLKLYLREFRNVGAFAEALASDICAEVDRVLVDAYEVTVTLEQAVRGGISLEVVATT